MMKRYAFGDVRSVRLRTVLDCLHCNDLEFGGLYRAGETQTARLVHADLSHHAGTDLPFPGTSKDDPDFSGEPLERWQELAIICTVMDNMYLTDIEKTVLHDGSHIYKRYLEHCDDERVVQHTFGEQKRKLGRWSKHDQKRAHTGDSELRYTQDFLIAMALNRAATATMVNVALDMVRLSPSERYEILAKRLPDSVWERQLFDKGRDVADHPWCPSHLAELTSVAT